MIRSLLTDHAAARARQRMGLCRRAAERMARRAYDYGLRRTDTHGQLRHWLDGKLAFHGHPDMRIYGEHVWVFGVHQVITVLWLPNELRAHARKQFHRLAHPQPTPHR
jgi:hypothetical protein